MLGQLSIALTVLTAQAPAGQLLAGFGAGAGPAQQGERTGRPAAPYSLEPVRTSPRGGTTPATVVGAGAGPAVVVPFDHEEDSVPLPVPRRTEPGADGTPDRVLAPASGDPYFLGFAAGNHHPPATERIAPDLLAGVRTTYDDGRPTSDTYAFVMFSKRITEARLEQLEQAGCRPLGFHPHYTWKVALPAAAIDDVAGLDFVRWIGLARPWQKLHPVLSDTLQKAEQSSPIEVWINVFEPDLDIGSTRLSGPPAVTPDGTALPSTPLDHVWDSSGWMHRGLEQLGVEVIDFNDRVNGFRARMHPGSVDLVAALDYVQFIEQRLPIELDHGESMAMVNADDVRNFYDGGVNQRSVVGIIDSGVAIAHQDLNHPNYIGWDWSGTSGPFNDDCGHGTHVGGTMMGRGVVDPAMAGAAPGVGWGASGRTYVLRIFGTCFTSFGDWGSFLSVLGSPADDGLGNITPVPHVANASFGVAPAGPPYVGTETDPRLIDDHVFSKAQVISKSAGNYGPLAGSLGLEATSKNALTVGNVLDWNDPGVLASNSSVGPCGDGRWKPNLVGPGNDVSSTSAFNTSGYISKSGTSMATPHVTGLAADLVDANGSFAYLPELVASTLMATAQPKGGALATLATDPLLDSYGAGRANGTQAIWGGAANWAFSLSGNSSIVGDFSVPVGATRLTMVMHYVEASASAGASQALVNDWESILDQPPLDPSISGGEWFAQQSAIDNTEIRTLLNPAPGGWRWKVYPASATGLAYFGVSVYVEVGDATPVLDPNLGISDTIVQPGEVVTVDYDLGTSGRPISAPFLNSSFSGATVLEALSFLKDGSVASLIGNMHAGSSIELGNIDPLFDRNAEWSISWPTQGTKSVCVTTSADNTLTNTAVDCTATVIVDGTAPWNPPNLMSTSHTPGVWSNDPSVSMAWGQIIDPIAGGVSSGVVGLSVLVAGAPSTPPTSANYPYILSNTFTAPASGSHYYNIRAVDAAGNWGPASSDGPFLIDVDPPGAITGLSSSSHPVGVQSCDPLVLLSWNPAIDNESGVAHYGILIDTTPVSTPSNTMWPSTTLAQVMINSSNGWYFHVRAFDQAGNGGPTAHYGPIYIDTDPTTTYCTPKMNSQGCLPAIGSSGSPSLASSSLVVTASNVLNNKVGLLFWGYAQSNNPFQGGIKCVASPTKRTPTQGSGGNPPPDDCSGAYAFTFDSAYMANKGIGLGDTIFCQWWSRDPSAPFTTGLTNALAFTVCP